MIDGLGQDRVAFLASVRNAAEAAIAVDGGADIIDGKDPARGALGALDCDVLGAVVAAVGGRVPVSATIGDLAPVADIMVAAARQVASTGVDIVKAGLFGADDPRTAIAALGAADLGGAKRVAVLMADMNPDFGLLPHLAAARFDGVMLDTAIKDGASLRDKLGADRISAFVAEARRSGLSAGLAGSLRLHDIAPLSAFHPDILGFRGALTVGGRADVLDLKNVRRIRQAIDSASDSASMVETRQLAVNSR